MSDPTPGDDGGAGSDADEFGKYPWEQSADEGLEWVHDDVITLFTTEGLVKIGGNRVPRGRYRGRAAGGTGRAALAPMSVRRFREEEYMDPQQQLCLGALFDIAATNGLDPSRRFCVLGFCRSIEMLNDVVAEAVLYHGGEIVVAEKETKGGLQEKLRLSVALPLLWGVPPAVEMLSYAIKSGGGIVEKVYRQWEFL